MVLINHFCLLRLGKSDDKVEISYLKKVSLIDEEFPQGAEQFCFPDKDLVTVSTNHLSENHIFALTNSRGIRQYGYCKRFRPSLEEDPENHPHCLCILSNLAYSWRGVFNELLGRLQLSIYSTFNKQQTFVSHLESISENIQNVLIGIKKNGIPKPGSSIILPISLNNQVIEFKCNIPADVIESRVPQQVNFATIFKSVDVNKLIFLFIAMLNERRIIFLSSNLTTITDFISAILSIIYPFSWQFIFIPILPPSFLNYCCAPMPFLLGVHSSHLKQVKSLPIDEILFVDLDGKKIIANKINKQDVLNVPEKLLCKLKQDLENTIREYQQTKVLNSGFISKSFREFFLTFLASYEENFQLDANSKPRFNLAKFLTTQPREFRDFCESFCNLQMFQKWIHEKELLMEKQIPHQTLFENEAVQWLKLHRIKFVEQISTGINTVMSLFQNFNYPNLNNNPANNNNNNQNTNANANANNTQISPQSSIYSNNIEKLKNFSQGILRKSSVQNVSTNPNENRVRKSESLSQIPSSQSPPTNQPSSNPSTKNQTNEKPRNNEISHSSSSDTNLLISIDTTSTLEEQQLEEKKSNLELLSFNESPTTNATAAIQLFDLGLTNTQITTNSVSDNSLLFFNEPVNNNNINNNNNSSSNANKKLIDLFGESKPNNFENNNNYNNNNNTSNNINNTKINSNIVHNPVNLLSFEGDSDSSSKVDIKSNNLFDPFQIVRVPEESNSKSDFLFFGDTTNANNNNNTTSNFLPLELITVPITNPIAPVSNEPASVGFLLSFDEPKSSVTQIPLTKNIDIEKLQINHTSLPINPLDNLFSFPTIVAPSVSNNEAKSDLLFLGEIVPANHNNTIDLFATDKNHNQQNTNLFSFGEQNNTNSNHSSEQKVTTSQKGFDLLSFME